MLAKYNQQNSKRNFTFLSQRQKDPFVTKIPYKPVNILIPIYKEEVNVLLSQ